MPVRSVEHMLQHIKEEHGEEIDYIMVRGWAEEEASQGWKEKEEKAESEDYALWEKGELSQE